MSCDVCTLVYLGIIFVTYTLVYKNLVYCHQFKDKIIIYKIGMRVSNIKYQFKLLYMYRYLL